MRIILETVKVSQGRKPSWAHLGPADSMTESPRCIELDPNLVGSLGWEDPAQLQHLDHICPILFPKRLNSNSRVGLLTEPAGIEQRGPSGKRPRKEITTVSLADGSA